MDHLSEVCRALRMEKLHATPKKCVFMTDRVIFLRFVVSSQGDCGSSENSGDCKIARAPKCSRYKKFSWACNLLQTIHKGVQHYHGSNYGLLEERRILVALTAAKTFKEIE